ncbi:MAG TPA: PAS domain-containing sensor histidine kinase [Gammaproteobacteria bacterium]
MKSEGVSSESLLRLLLEQGKDHALVLIDEKGMVTGWLMGAAKLFGYEAEEVLGRNFDFLFVPEDRERGVPQSELDIGSRFGRQEDDRWMLRKDGVRVWVSGILTGLRGPDGKVAGYSKVMRDRTDLKEHVELLNNRALTLETETRQKTIMLGTLAHELRNPIGVLSNATQLMEMIYPQENKLAPVTQLIGRQVKYLSTLIEDLLENARLQAGKVELQVEPVDLRDLLTDAVESVVSIQEKRQKTELILPQSSIEVCVDEVKAKQIFVNLLSNASKFSDEGKTIWVRVITEDDQAVVRVEDEGRGIPPELLPRLFELFSQGETGRDNASLGLGLSIVKQYVELHGGTVQARSEGLNRGSMFVVRLPLVRKGS